MSGVLQNLYIWRGQIVNGLLYQIVWLVAVFWGAGWAFLQLLIFLLVHFVFVIPAVLGDGVEVSGKRIRREVVFILLVSCAGYCVDSLWFASGMIVQQSASFLAPAWLFCIWVAFAATLNYALAVLHSRLLFAAAIGAWAGPATYGLGISLNPALSPGVNEFVFAACVGLVWAALLPVLMVFTNYYFYAVPVAKDSINTA